MSRWLVGSSRRSRLFSFSPAAQIVDTLHHLILRKQETTQHFTDITFIHVRIFMPQFFEDIPVGGEFGLLLVIVADGDIRAVDDFSVSSCLISFC